MTTYSFYFLTAKKVLFTVPEQSLNSLIQTSFGLKGLGFTLVLR